MELNWTPHIKQKILSPQETPKSVGGSKQIMYYNVVDDGDDGDDDDVVDDDGDDDGDVDDDDDDDDDDDADADADAPADDDDGDDDDGDDDDDDDDDGDDDDGDDDDDEDEDEDEDGDERKMMMIWVLRRRRMMKLRRIMLRTFHRSHFGFKFTGKKPDANPAASILRACAVEMHMDISQEPFCTEIYRENAGRPGYHLD